MRDDRRVALHAGPIRSQPRAGPVASVRSHSVIIASSDASPASIAGADYVVQVGTDAGPVVQAAVDRIAECPTGGSLRFSEGHFVLRADEVSIRAVLLPATALTISGAGDDATVLTFEVPFPNTPWPNDGYLTMFECAPSPWPARPTHFFDYVFEDLTLRLGPVDDTGAAYLISSGWYGGDGDVTVNRCVLDAAAAEFGYLFDIYGSQYNAADGPLPPVGSMRVIDSQLIADDPPDGAVDIFVSTSNVSCAFTNVTARNLDVNIFGDGRNSTLITGVDAVDSQFTIRSGGVALTSSTFTSQHSPWSGQLEVDSHYANVSGNTITYDPPGAGDSFVGWSLMQLGAQYMRITDNVFRVRDGITASYGIGLWSGTQYSLVARNDLRRLTDAVAPFHTPIHVFPDQNVFGNHLVDNLT